MNILLRRSQKPPMIIRNFYYRRVKEGCECPDTKPKEKIVEEKACGCCFENWRPKQRELIECEVKKSMEPKGPKNCYAGMVTTKPPPDCKPAEIDPFKKKCCLEEKKIPEKEVPPKPKEKTLPYADWDLDCR